MKTEFSAENAADALLTFAQHRKTGNLFPRRSGPMALVFSDGVARYVDIDTDGADTPEDGAEGRSVLAKLAAEQHFGEVVAVF